ncbi:MAG: hypothetical protein HY726_09730 [Candidatus Rokubacteria bacterium]|nr:hypothetical protein [Candidatus Rokubacteria bacterium]
MDLTHVIVIGLVVVGIAAPIVGLVILGRMLKRDEAIDAAIYLAHRQTQEFLKEYLRQRG